METAGDVRENLTGILANRRMLKPLIRPRVKWYAIEMQHTVHLTLAGQVT